MALNKVILMGNLCRDPELKITASSDSVVSFSIAVQRRFRKADGTYDTDFFNVTAWRKTAEFVHDYFHKGSSIAIVGSLQTRSYVDKQGNNRYVTEIVADEVSFAGGKSESDSNQSSSTAYTKPQQAVAADQPPQFTVPPTSNAPKFEEITDEELPF